MRICLFTHTFPRFKDDNAAPFMAGLAQGLVDAGNEVFVLTPYDAKFQYSHHHGYKIVTYKYIFPKWLHLLGYSKTLQNDMSIKPVMYFLSPFMFLFGFLALLKLVKKEQIQLINAHWILPNGFIASLVSFLTRVPLVITLPGSDVYLAAKNSLLKQMTKFSVSQASFITSNSPQLLDDLRKIVGINFESESIIYGVEDEIFHPNKHKASVLKKSLGIDEDKLIILGVGRLVAKKGFKYLLKAIQEIIRVNRNAFLVIVGDGDQKGELQNLADRLDISTNVLFTGAVNYKDLVDYYNLADIFVLPSIRDEKGNLDDQSVAVVEAMSCAKPVITTNFPGYNLIINDKNLLVPEKDSKALARILIKLMRSKEEREKIGERNRTLVEDNFSWRAIGSDYMRLFSKILNSKSFYSDDYPDILKEEDRLRIGNQFLEIIKSQVNNTNDLSCLDIGCSGGTITHLLSKYFKHVWGVDVDIRAIQQAKKKYHKDNLTFLISEDERMPFKDNTFDVIVCNQTYEFVQNQKKLSDEIFRVIKPGGICIIGARNKWAFLEGQTGIPVIHFFPDFLAHKISTMLGKDYYSASYLSYWEINKLFKKFEITNLTPDIIHNPKKFGFNSLEKYSTITRFIPYSILKKITVFSPNQIIICKKV